MEHLENSVYMYHLLNSAYYLLSSELYVHVHVCIHTYMYISVLISCTYNTYEHYVGHYANTK